MNIHMNIITVKAVAVAETIKKYKRGLLKNLILYFLAVREYKLYQWKLG